MFLKEFKLVTFYSHPISLQLVRSKFKYLKKYINEQTRNEFFLPIITLNKFLLRVDPTYLVIMCFSL